MRSRLLKTLLLVLVTLAPGVALADFGWRMYLSQTGAFSVMFPDENQENVVAFRLGPKRIAYSGEMSAVQDSRPYKNMIKRYFMRVDQALGAPLSEAEINAYLNRDIESYIAYYKTMRGVLQDREDGTFHHYPGSEIFITFEDPELGPQAVRAVFMATDVSKLQQVIVGPEDAMYALKTNDFFEKVVLNRGYDVQEGEFGEGWQMVTSPLEIFSAMLPPVTPPFVPNEYIVQQKDDGKSELVSVEFFDPVRAQRVFYNIFGYRKDEEMTYSGVQDILARDHVHRYGGNPANVEFTKAMIDGIPVLETTAAIRPPADLPYATHIRLKAFFYGSYLVVQEFISSPQIITGDFTNEVLNMLQFHPDKALAKAGGTVAAPAPAPAPAEAVPAAAP